MEGFKRIRERYSVHDVNEIHEATRRFEEANDCTKLQPPNLPAKKGGEVVVGGDGIGKLLMEIIKRLDRIEKFCLEYLDWRTR